MLKLPYYKAENYRYVLDAPRDGKVVIQLMNSKSLFTNSQHFILIKGYNENGLLDVLDPSEKNRSGWYLMDKFENGFTEDELCWGYDGAWIYDPDQMPDDPFIYEPPVRANGQRMGFHRRPHLLLPKRIPGSRNQLIKA